MKVATDTLTVYLAVEVHNLISDFGVAGVDALVEQGWSLPRIEAYYFVGRAAA